MSLSLFSVKTKYYKNGIDLFKIKEFGGLLDL